MEILEAYCIELRRVVEIYEAQEEYFCQPLGRRRRFQFRCSDPGCRAEKDPLVVGANYHKNAEESDKYQQPHFKSHQSHPHAESCIWVVNEARKRKESLSEGQHVGQGSVPKATNVIDVFEPRQSDTPLYGAAQAQRTARLTNSETEKQERGHGNDRTGTTTTSRLEKLIDCWSRIEPEMRRALHITIDRRVLTYHQVCLRVPALSEVENGTRVVYGGAHVKAWPTGTPTHYFVSFIDACDRFPEQSGGRSLTISLPIKRLNQSRRGVLLTDRIMQASRPEHYLRVYAWGNIVARSGRKGYELRIDSLDNLVLKAIRKKPIGKALQASLTETAR